MRHFRGRPVRNRQGGAARVGGSAQSAPQAGAVASRDPNCAAPCPKNFGPRRCRHVRWHRGRLCRTRSGASRSRCTRPRRCQREQLCSCRRCRGLGAGDARAARPSQGRRRRQSCRGGRPTGTRRHGGGSTFEPCCCRWLGAGGDDAPRGHCFFAFGKNSGLNPASMSSMDGDDDRGGGEYVAATGPKPINQTRAPTTMPAPSSSSKNVLLQTAFKAGTRGSSNGKQRQPQSRVCSPKTRFHVAASERLKFPSR